MRHKWYTSNPQIMSSTISSMFDGLLLSDGYICSRTGRTGRFQQSCKYKEFLDMIATRLNILDIKCNVIPKTYKLKSKEFNDYFLSTGTYIEFKTIFNRWYKLWYDNPNDDTNYRIVKIVPKDIILNPECVLFWYLGDGSINIDNHSCHIKLSTSGFIKKDVVFLLELLNETVGINSRINKEHYKPLNKFYYQIIIGRKKDMRTFIEYINYNYLEPNCYGYKFPSELYAF